MEWSPVTEQAVTTSLLDPLDEKQQALVEVVGEVFAERPGLWPIFDYVEAMLDDRGIDAQETLVSFPIVDLAGGTYSAVCQRSRTPSRLAVTRNARVRSLCV